MTVRSNPPGAFVYIDNHEIGVTPCSTDFVYYGTRQFRLVREGYETLTVDKKVSAPWYEWYGLDFVSENLVPTEIRDERTLDFDLVPQRLIAPEQLVANGNQLRQGNQPVTFVTPLGGGPQSGIPPVFTPGQGVAPIPGQPGSPVFGPAPGITPPQGANPQLPPGWTPYSVTPRIQPEQQYYPPIPGEPAPQMMPLPPPQ